MLTAAPHNTWRFYREQTSDRILAYGTYALIDKNESRNKDIRKPRPSIRAQLQSEKEKAVPKRTAKVKKHDLEV